MSQDVGTAKADGEPGPEAAESAEQAVRRSRRWVSIRVFSSASDATRARRPTDGVLLALAILGAIVLSFSAPGPTALDTATKNLVAELPGLVGWFWEISYALLIVWSVSLLLLALFAHGRKRLFLDELLALALALASAILVGLTAGTDPPTSLEGLVNTTSPPIYLATRVALATAVIVAASPHLTRPLRNLGRWLLGVGMLSGIALGAALPNGTAAGFLIGFSAAALTHLLVGSPGGRLTLDQVSEALIELGVLATDLRDAELQPRGAGLVLATTPEGHPLRVKIFGRDAWDGQLFASIWTSIWHRGAKRVGTGRLQQVEHEAFVTLLAERAGVAVAPVVAAGEADQGDALLVLESSGRTFASLESAEVDDELLRGYWRILSELHHQGVSYGRVEGGRLSVRPDGSPAFLDFGAARIAASENDLRTDDAQLLVMSELFVGSDRAIDAAIDVIGADGLIKILPFLQPAVFDRDTRKALHTQALKLKDLRKQCAERTEGEIPPLEPIRRVSWASLAKLAAIGLLAYWLFSSLAGIDINSIIDEFKSADWTWIFAALVVTPFVQVPQAFSTMGATMHEIQFWPVLMLQYGVQFIQLVVPSSAARIALEVRFWQCVGVPGAGALSIGALDSFSTFILQMLLIVIILASGVVTVNASSSDSSSSSGSSSSINWEAVLIAVALVAIALVIALLIPKTRAMLHRFREILREKKADVKEALRVLRHPKKLLLLLGGNLIAQVMLAIILGMCLKAFGQSASLAALILVNTFVSLFAGFMPVPGGVGVAEAGYTAGLIAIGIPDAAATSTALAFRLVTFYLPPIWGTFATRWMKKNSFL